MNIYIYTHAYPSRYIYICYIYIHIHMYILYIYIYIFMNIKKQKNINESIYIYIYTYYHNTDVVPIHDICFLRHVFPYFQDVSIVSVDFPPGIASLQRHALLPYVLCFVAALRSCALPAWGRAARGDAKETLSHSQGNAPLKQLLVPEIQ